MSATITPSGSANPVANRLRREFHIDGIVQGSAFAPSSMGWHCATALPAMC